MYWWGITKRNDKLKGTFCRRNGIFRTFVKIGNNVNKQFYVNISMSYAFLLATNYMLKALCRKGTTRCETYSRIVTLWNISQTRSNMFKTRCAKKVHSDDVLHGRNTCQGHLAGKRRRIQACYKQKWQVERRFHSQKTVWSERVKVRIACCRCFTREKLYIDGTLCHVVGRFVDKKRHVQQDMLRYERAC